MSLATRQTVERALAAYLKPLDFGGLSLAGLGGKFKGEESEEERGLSLHCIPGEVGDDGELPEEWGTVALPALIIACASSAPHIIGYDICEVGLTFITTPDELQAPEKIQMRVGWLSAVFDESRLEEIAALLSPPAVGPDTRPVKGLHVIGIERAGESHAPNGMHVMGTVRLRVHALGLPDPE